MQDKILNFKRIIENNSWIYLLVIIGIALGIYAQSVKFDFIYFDENEILLQNKSFFTNDFSLKKFFTTDAFLHYESAYYRPLQNLSFAIDALMANGIIFWVFHLTNVILFILTGISLYFLLQKFKISPHFAFLGALLFIVNPLNVWSVVWVPARGDLLLTLFTLLSFICFINFLKNKSFFTLFLTFLCFSLALFSKETAAFIPFLFLVYYWVKKRFFIFNYKFFLLGGLMFGVGIVWFYLRYYAIMHFDSMITWKDFMYNLLNIPVALSQMVFPYEMSPFPTFTIPKIVLGTILLLVFSFIVIKKTETGKGEKMFFLFWFILLLFPTLFVKGINVDYFEHRYLLPQIGILALLIKTIFVPIVNWIRQQSSHHHIITSSHLIFFGVVLVFGITSYVKAQTLKNLFTVVDAVEKYEGNPIYPYTNRGIYYIDNEMYDEAKKDLNKVLQMDAKNFIALNNLGKISMIFQEYENAITFFNRSLSINNKVEGAYYNRSFAKTCLGNLESALLDLDSAIILKKNIPLLYNNRGVLRMNLGFTNEALQDFDNAIKFSNSTYCDAFGNRAYAKFLSGNYAAALQDCNSALQLEPENEALLALKERIKKSPSN